MAWSGKNGGQTNGSRTEAWTAWRERITSDESVSPYAQPDEDTFVASAKQVFGGDLLNPPSLHARRMRA